MLVTICISFAGLLPTADSRRAVFSYWRKDVQEVLVNRLGGLSLPRKSVVRLTDCPDMTLDVYRGRKTTTTTMHKLSRWELKMELRVYSRSGSNKIFPFVRNVKYADY